MPDTAGRVRNKGDQPVVIFPSEWPHSATLLIALIKKRDECTSRVSKNMELLEQFILISAQKTSYEGKPIL